MLTKTDLQQIGKIVDDRLDQKLDEKLEPIKKDLKYLKKKVNRIDKTVSLTVKNYDEVDVRLEKRVRKIEEHIGLTS